MTALKFAGALALSGALLLSTGCGLKERFVPCNVVFDELDALHRKWSADFNGYKPSDPYALSSPYRPLSSSDAQFFEDAASKIRNAGKRLDKDGPAESKRIAAKIDRVAAFLRRVPPGRSSAAYGEEIEGEGVLINNSKLKAACGRPEGYG
ncbi:hypothetical protein [Actinomadura sp. 3N407]|uniref:hypothetical protein n=1 Tax=Actinomadura sp. 3N407 TaxID=3457423 RepID=UPI003FCE54A6